MKIISYNQPPRPLDAKDALRTRLKLRRFVPNDCRVDGHGLAHGVVSKKIHVSGGDFVFDLDDVDAFTQHSLDEMRLDAIRNSRLFALSRVRTSVSNKDFYATYDTVSWNAYCMQTDRDDADSVKLVDPSSRQTVLGVKTYIFDSRRNQFELLHDSDKHSSYSWQHSFLSVLSGIETEPVAQLIFFQLVAKISPSVKTSLLLSSHLNRLRAQSDDFYSVATQALAEASRFGFRELLLPLIRLGADIDGVGTPGGRPLVNAVAFGKRLVVRDLLLLGAEPNAVDWGSGHSALHLAAGSGDVELTRGLRAAGATLSITNSEGLNVRQFAAKMRQTSASDIYAQVLKDYQMSCPYRHSVGLRSALYAYVDDCSL